MKSESEALPIATISIRNEPQEIPGAGAGIGVPGVMVAFPNGVRAPGSHGGGDNGGSGTHAKATEGLPLGLLLSRTSERRVISGEELTL